MIYLNDLGRGWTGFAVSFNMGPGRFRRVMCCLLVVAVGQVRVVCCRFVFACFVVLCGFLVMSCRAFVMLCCLLMMLCCLF
jgi:hypothetical protein